MAVGYSVQSFQVVPGWALDDGDDELDDDELDGCVVHLYYTPTHAIRRLQSYHMCIAATLVQFCWMQVRVACCRHTTGPLESP